MLSPDFVAVYDRQLPIDYGAHTRADMASVREFSQSFGISLHDYLASGEAAGTEAYVTASASVQQSRLAIRHIVNSAWARVPEEGYENFNALSFPIMNDETFRMWYPIYHGSWEGTNKQSAINASQDKLALRGLHLFLDKVRLAGARSEQEYLSEDFSLQRRVLEGMLNEFDAGIVLLEFVRRHSGLTVVPAPVQFEHHKKSYNADFIICDDSRAAGVQVKSTVRTSDMARYDRRRIALVDASLDLGNVMAKKTSDRRQPVKTVGWAGLICAHQVCQIKTHGQMPKHLASVKREDLLRKKMHAKQLTAGCSPYLRQAVGRIGSRIEAIL